MKTFIADTDQFILVPVYDPELPLPSRGVFGSDLKKVIDEPVLLDALENGKPLIYKGNEYFIDEKLVG